jgi:hypothetical protein
LFVFANLALLIVLGRIMKENETSGLAVRDSDDVKDKTSSSFMFWDAMFPQVVSIDGWVS